MHKDCIDIINTIVRIKHRNFFYLKREDLVSAANFIYANCLTKYKKKSNAKFSTYLYAALSKTLVFNTFYLLIDNYNIVSLEEDSYIEEEYENYLLNKVSLDKSIASLSQEAKYIIDIIFSNPEEIEIEKNNITGICMDKIKKFLRTKGWQYKKIDTTISEIKNMLRDLS